MIDYIPPEFEYVPFGSIEASSCAPYVDDLSWRGIMIRMPEEIRLEPDDAPILPICGFYQLSSLPLVQGAAMVVHLRGVNSTMVEEQSGRVVITDGQNEPDIPDPAANEPIDPELWRYKVSTAFFHLNGQSYFREALSPGSYELYVSYGDTKSNIVGFTVNHR